MTCPSATYSLGSSTTVHLLTLLQPHWPSCCSRNIPSTTPLQKHYIWSFFCLEKFILRKLFVSLTASDVCSNICEGLLWSMQLIKNINSHSTPAQSRYSLFSLTYFFTIVFYHLSLFLYVSSWLECKLQKRTDFTVLLCLLLYLQHYWREGGRKEGRGKWTGGSAEASFREQEGHFIAVYQERW